MNKLKAKELQQALTNLFKLGIDKTNNSLTIVFGKTQTLLLVRKLDEFYQINNNGFIEFAAVLDAENQEEGLALIRDAVNFKNEISKLESEDIEFELIENELIVNNGVYVTKYSSLDMLSRITMNSQTMVTLALNGRELQQAYKQLLLYKGQDWLNGIHHELRQNELIIGTDTLSLETISCLSDKDKLEFLVTYDMAKTLSKVKAGNVKICVEENESSLHIRGSWYIRFILDGRYLLESTVKKGQQNHLLK